MSKRIELTDRQTDRFEKIKEECSGEFIPEPTDELVFDGLLDTWKAVNEGYYSE